MFNDLWDELDKKSTENLGLEKAEELQEASGVLDELFSSDAVTGAIMSALAIATGAASLEKVLWAQFLTGCGIYREFMLSNGVDVDSIEKKALEEKRKG